MNSLDRWKVKVSNGESGMPMPTLKLANCLVLTKIFPYSIDFYCSVPCVLIDSVEL